MNVVSRFAALALTAGLAAGIGAIPAAALAQQDAGGDEQGRADEAHAGPRVVRSGGLWAWQTYGSFRKTTYEVDGVVSFVEDEDGRVSVDFDKAFEIDEKGPFAVHASTSRADAIDRDNALRGATRLGAVRRTKGAQRFELPNSVEASRVRSIVLYDTDKDRLAAVLPVERGRVISASHDWGDKAKKTSGSYEIVERDGARFIRFSDDFKTSRPPEPLRLLLSPRSVRDSSKRNAERGARQIATLRSHKGEQEYRIPDDVDLSEYESILLWCKPYEILFAASPLVEIDDPAGA